MRISIKDVGFAVFFLIVIAVVAVQANEEQRDSARNTPIENVDPAGSAN